MTLFDGFYFECGRALFGLVVVGMVGAAWMVGGLAYALYREPPPNRTK